jgi:hypothetical protein
MEDVGDFMHDEIGEWLLRLEVVHRDKAGRTLAETHDSWGFLG